MVLLTASGSDVGHGATHLGGEHLAEGVDHHFLLSSGINSTKFELTCKITEAKPDKNVLILYLDNIIQPWWPGSLERVKWLTNDIKNDDIEGTACNRETKS